MAILSSPEIVLLRSRPHNTKLYLSIYQPSTVLACRLNNASAKKGDRILPYDGVTEGSHLLVQSGMTMYVGTGAGAFDKGMVRVRSATSSQIVVAENSHIDWKDDDYLTVVNFFEINAVYPRIIQDPSDETKTIWYKDYDIAYTNQNSVLGTFINMGSHFAGFLDNGVCNVYYSASGTYNLREDTLSYHWFFEGASVTGSNAHTPGYIAYNTPGHYTTRLIVSGSSTGAVDVSYRHVSIYNRPGEGENTPVLKWELIDLSGSRAQGGYIAKIRIHEIIPQNKLREGSLIVIFADDWYGNIKQSIGGNALGRQSIVFVGYVLRGTIQYNYRHSYMEFEAGSPTEVMKQAEGFGVSIQHSNDPSSATSDPNIPSSWVVVLNMDTRRALYHYLRWHSTALLCNDFSFIGTDRPLQYFDADRTSLFDAISNAMKGILVGEVVSDRQGKIWMERSIFIEPSLYQTNFELTSKDWVEDISIGEEGNDKVAFIEAGGVAFSGATGTYAALLSNAPGVAPGYRGSVERIQGLSLLSQAELNSISFALYAQRNAKYPSLEVTLAGNYRAFDIAPQEKIPITIAPSDTVRGISFSSKPFFIQRMSWEYDPRLELFYPSVNLEELVLTDGVGDTVTIPPVPTETGGFNVPSINVPQIVIPPYPTISVGTLGSPPSFVPIQAAWNTSIGNIPLGIWSVANGPAVCHVLPGGDDHIVVGSFVVPLTYSGQITIYFVYAISQAGGTGNFLLELYYERYPLSSGYWSSPSAVYDTITSSPGSYSVNRLYYAFPLQMSVSPGDFITLWARDDASSATFNKARDLVGWYIVYV